MDKNDKLSFDELLKSGQVIPDEYKNDQPIFKDEPKKHDYTIFFLVIVAVLCILGCVYYTMYAMKPIETTASVSGTSIQSHLDSVSKQYKDGKVNINTAKAEALTTLKGIGESKALAIMAYRESNGPFKTIYDIKNVSGIGDATFEKIKNDICV